MTKASNILPSQDDLHRVLEYDHATGLFFWKMREGDDLGTRIFNSRFPGKPALTAKSKAGYFVGDVLGIRVFAHRVAWKWHYGTDPEFIDHINGDGFDNRIDNLRSVSKKINSRNRRLNKNNKSGITGVFWVEHVGRWQVTVASKVIGRFETFEEAVSARKIAETGLGFHENHGRL